MLVVAAIKLRHPMILIILVKTHDMTPAAFHIAICKPRLALTAGATRDPVPWKQSSGWHEDILFSHEKQCAGWQGCRQPPARSS